LSEKGIGVAIALWSIAQAFSQVTNGRTGIAIVSNVEALIDRALQVNS
jgi:hypothetical protein